MDCSVGVAEAGLMIDVQLHRSIAEFGDIADHLYGRDPVLFTMELTALKSASPSPDNILLSVWDGGQLLGVLLRTPPYAAMVSGLPPLAAPFVAKILAQAGYELASISGLTANAIAFADAWRVATAAKTTVEIEEQLYRLGTLHSPAGVIGKPRAANETTSICSPIGSTNFMWRPSASPSPRTVRALSSTTYSS